MFISACRSRDGVYLYSWLGKHFYNNVHQITIVHLHYSNVKKKEWNLHHQNIKYKINLKKNINQEIIMIFMTNKNLKNSPNTETSYGHLTLFYVIWTRYQLLINKRRTREHRDVESTFPNTYYFIHNLC